MIALIKKHSVVPTFKKAGVSYSSKFRLKKEVCHLELLDISDISLEVMKSIWLTYLIIMAGGQKVIHT